MSRTHRFHRFGRTAALTVGLGILLASGVARAGEVKFSAETLETDDNGNLTKDARASAKGKVESVAPDEELWQVSVWAQIDKGAQGPLYVEFYREHAGKKLMAYSHEEADYDGGKYWSMNIELARDMGFRFDDVLSVEVLQIGGNDKKKILAKAKLTLLESTKEPAPMGGSGGGGGGDDLGDDGGDGEEDVDEQDARDSLAGPEEDEEGEPDAPDEGPPPVDAESKKGCNVDSSGGLPWALAVLLALGLVARKD